MFVRCIGIQQLDLAPGGLWRSISRIMPFVLPSKRRVLLLFIFELSYFFAISREILCKITACVVVVIVYWPPLYSLH